jgi:hypothetical protein
LHRQFLACYRRAEIDEAQAALAEARRGKTPALDGLYHLYAQRLAAMKLMPPDKEWDGVFAVEKK